MYNPLKQGRDEKGRFSSSPEFLSAARTLEKNLVKGKVQLLRSRPKGMGASTRGAFYSGPGKPLIFITAPKILAHEVGHAVDYQLGSKTAHYVVSQAGIEEPQFTHSFFSENPASGIPRALELDVRRLRAADLKEVGVGSHIVSSPHEAFAHAYHALRRPQDVRSEAVRRVLPNTLKATERIVKQASQKFVSLNIGHR